MSMDLRFMRIMVFFDLPMLTDKNKAEYNRFRKFLVKNGFIMMQKSVYTKLVSNNVMSQAVKKTVRDNLPSEGLVEMLEVTERQFSGIEYLLGKAQTQVLDTMDRYVEI